MRNLIMASLLVLFSIYVGASAAEDDIFEIEAEGSYRMGAGASLDLAKKMALFTAKKQAVDLAGRYLSRKSLIEVYGLNRDEIYSLAAREIEAKILKENRQTVGKTSTYRVRIRAQVQPSDFIKAEMEDTKQDRSEANESYSEEMEQPVSAEIDPGKDISKAYRLLREKKWRIAMIYLNHLEKKYPNWDSIYVAKAITHYILHETVFMKKALKEACRLGNQIACDDLKNIKKVHEHDFGLSVID
jgi:TolA-binding protein